MNGISALWNEHERRNGGVDLDEEYKQTYRDYRETGIPEGSMLRRFSELGSIRYFAQLSLASFTQGRRGRLHGAQLCV
jgi:hypothetical protein